MNQLTPDQLQAAREQLEANAEADRKAVLDRVVFEARRDAAAYALIQAARAKREKLTFGEAQALAAKQIEGGPAPAPKPETPAPSKKSSQ